MPMVEFTAEEVSLMKEALAFAKRRVSEGRAPYDVKQAKLAKLDEVLARLRQAH